jgi:hypothetical protein
MWLERSFWFWFSIFAIGSASSYFSLLLATFVLVVRAFGCVGGVNLSPSLSWVFLGFSWFYVFTSFGFELCKSFSLRVLSHCFWLFRVSSLRFDFSFLRFSSGFTFSWDLSFCIRSSFFSRAVRSHFSFQSFSLRFRSVVRCSDSLIVCTLRLRHCVFFFGFSSPRVRLFLCRGWWKGSSLEHLTWSHLDVRARTSDSPIAVGIRLM